MAAKQNIGVDLLDQVRVAGEKAVRDECEGARTEVSPIKGGLLRSGRVEQSMAIIGGADAPRVSGSPLKAAARLYNENRRALALPRDQRALGRGRVLRDPDMQITSYEPRVRGLKVDGARVVLGVATNRRANENMLLTLNSDARLDWRVKGAFKMRREDAVSAAAESLGIRLSSANVRRLLEHGHVRVERVLAPHRNSLCPAMRVTPVGISSQQLKEEFGNESIEVVVDAENGFVIRTRPMAEHLNATISAYDENPIKSFRNIDRTSHIVDSRFAEITAPSSGPHILRNQHLNVVPGQYLIVNGQQVVKERTGRATGSGSGHNEFLYAYDNHPNISEANAFVHLNRIRQMLLRINPSFTTQTKAPAGSPMDVYVDIPAGSFNALSYRDGHLEFWATGGVGAADDADIVVHEYGHQVHFVLAPNVYASEVGEGIADFIATIYAHDTSVSELFNNRSLVTNGDILQPDFSLGPYSSLREIYNDFRYPEDYTGETGHRRSRILSGALMELHLESYGQFGDLDYYLVPRTLLAALELMPAGAGLLDAASTFAGLVALVAIFSGAEKWTRLALHTQRVFSRRGLI